MSFSCIAIQVISPVLYKGAIILNYVFMKVDRIDQVRNASNDQKRRI